MDKFVKIKKKNKINDQKDFKIILKEKVKNENNSLMEMNNYMLTKIRKENLSSNMYKLSFSKLAKISPIAIPIANNIKTIMKQKPTTKDKLYRITNLGKNDSLKAMKDGKTFWKVIKNSDKVNSNASVLDSVIILMSVALVEIEQEFGKIKELSKKIFSFLEYEKESNLEILNKFLNDFRLKIEDEKYLVKNHKQVMDIKKSANEDRFFYMQEIEDDLTNNSMNYIIDDIKEEFKYYKLSLYIYSFSTFMEILLLGNYQSDYLLNKKNELIELDNEYKIVFNKVLEYINKNANKSLEGEFEKMKESNCDLFIKQIEKVDSIINKTKEIYFDNENIYLKI